MVDSTTGASSLQFDIKECISGAHVTSSSAMPCCCSNEMWIVSECGDNPMLVAFPLHSQVPEVTAEFLIS